MPRAPDPRTPPPARRSRTGWRVAPAPDGRGKPRPKPPMLPFGARRFFGILFLLLFLNWVLVAVFAPAEKRISVPYTPTFLAQVRAGNVKEISSKGETVQGDFKKEVKYDGESATHFKTEVPTFANTDQLSQVLEDQKVVVNAKAPGDRSLLETLLFSFGPTLLIVGLFIWLA
jgi:cell division protease FtsH